jgi:hypothetical protein
MAFSSPGFADDLPADLVAAWNATIEAQYDSLKGRFGSRFFHLDAAALGSTVAANIHWRGSPAEPAFCLGEKVAKQLADWGAIGRHGTQNEYCEYAITYRTDSAGRTRPKRVQVTTELREYWVTIAKRDPDFVRSMIKDVLGTEPSWNEIYGVDDPLVLDERQREIRFSRLVAGNGRDPAMEAAGVPVDPTGSLNNDNALFMSHPINGLDDLLYIVMFGAKPYRDGLAGGGPPQMANREQIFRRFDVEHLACRHADPAAAMGAYEAVFAGSAVAFDDPIGMYIKSFSPDLFTHDNGKPIPAEWIRFSRGRDEGLFQRLEFGPPDDSPAFLDDITVTIGANTETLDNGYRVVDAIEVGPRAVAGPPSPIPTAEYIALDTSRDPIVCAEADVCSSIRALKQRYDDAHQDVPSIRMRGR